MHWATLSCFPRPAVFISTGCPNKVPQTKTGETYSFTVPKARRPKLRGQLGCGPLKAPGDSNVLPTVMCSSCPPSPTCIPPLCPTPQTQVKGHLLQEAWQGQFPSCSLNFSGVLSLTVHEYVLAGLSDQCLPPPLGCMLHAGRIGRLCSSLEPQPLEQSTCSLLSIQVSE